MQSSDDRDARFADRLRKAMYVRSMTVSRLAKETGIGESTIHRYLSGEREPIYGNLLAMANVLKADLNFLGGIDRAESGRILAQFIDKLVSDVRGKLGVLELKDEDSDIDPARMVGMIPVLGKVSEGPSLEFDGDGQPRGRPAYAIPALGDADRFAYGLQFEGDSMNSRILDGDVVIFSPEIEWRSGDLGVVRMGDGQMFVRVILEKPSSYVLRSYNPARDLEEIEKQQISFIHKLTSIRPKDRPHQRDTGYRV